MASSIKSVKISELPKFGLKDIEPEDLEKILIPMSKDESKIQSQAYTTKTITLCDFISIIADNIEIWDLTTFADDTSPDDTDELETTE